MRVLISKLVYGFLVLCTIVVGAILTFEAAVIAALSVMAWW